MRFSFLLSLLLLRLDLFNLFRVTLLGSSLPLLILLCLLLTSSSIRIIVESLGLELIKHLLHRVLILLGLSASGEEVEALLHLLLELLSEGGSLGLLGEGVDAGGDRALVREVARDATLVLLTGTADEGRVEDKTVLRGLALGLKGAEEGLLGTQDLDGGGWVLSEVNQGARVGNQFGADHFTDQSSKVRGNCIHSLSQVFRKFFTEFDLFNNSL
jgi:hypothetical protein